MPWKECNKMDERLKFVARLLKGEKMAPLCREFGIKVNSSRSMKRWGFFDLILNPLLGLVECNVFYAIIGRIGNIPLSRTIYSLYVRVGCYKIDLLSIFSRGCRDD